MQPVSPDLAALTRRIEELERSHAASLRELRKLRDMEEIRQLKYRYFRGIDSGDLDLLASVLTPDFNCRFRSDTSEFVASSRDEFVRKIGLFASDRTAAQHQGHHPEITLDDDHARALWYLQDIVHHMDAQLFLGGTCFYKDSYVRTADGWKLQSSWWDRHLEIRQISPFQPNYTARYLKTHGRKHPKPPDIGLGSGSKSD